MNYTAKSILALLPFFFVTAPASAFTLLYSSSGSGITSTGWQKNDITFDIDTSCASFTDDVNASIGAAADIWNHVPSSGLKISIGGTVTLSGAITTYVGSGATASAPAGNPIIYCDTSFQSDSGEPADSIPGFAGAQNMTSAGLLQGGLLVLNFQTSAKANIHTLGADLSSIVLAHEMGHVLGLGHSSDTNALMYYSTNSSRKLVLAQDDINGISYLYPRSEPSNGFLGCGTLSVVGAQSGKRGGRGRGPRDGGGGSGAAEFAMLLAVAACASFGWPRSRNGGKLGAEKTK